MKTLVVIGARGGSKGVKNKNIRPLLGKPLIAHTIECARRWSRTDRLVVSTDSDEIASIATEFGAEVPFMRPVEMATDTSDKFPVIRHALLESEKFFSQTFDVLVDLDATSPLRTPQDLDAAFSIFEKTGVDTLFSVVKAHKNPYFNMVERNSDGKITLSKPLLKNVHRRQDAPQVYSMNASIYFYRRSYLLNPENSSPITLNSEIYVMNDICGHDIDRELDFKFVEFILREGAFKL